MAHRDFTHGPRLRGLNVKADFINRQLDGRLRKANHAYAKVRPSEPYTAAFMGASRKKVVTSEGSKVSFTKYNGHSESISWGSRFQRCGAR